MKEIIRYDRLYSTNEVVVLFCGTREGVDSLDRRIGDFNGRLRAQRHLSPAVGLIDITSYLNPMPSSEALREKIVKAYRLELKLLPDKIKRQIETGVESELNGYRKDRNADLENNFPIFIEAEIMMAAEEKLPLVRDKIRRDYTGHPESRGEEINLYTFSLLYLAAEEKPWNVYVFPREYRKPKKR